MAHRHPLSPGGSTYAILDTNVLLPPRLSDILFDLHGQGLYLPRWTAEIEVEFLRNWGDVVQHESKAGRSRAQSLPPMTAEQVQRGAAHRLSCFRAAVGIDYEIMGYDAPQVVAQVPANTDPKDVHVVAAGLVFQDALEDTADVDRIYIVSANLDDLAVKQCEPLGLHIIGPGAFIDLLTNLEADRVGKALERSVGDLQRSLYSREQLFGTLKLYGAHATCAFLQRQH